MNSKEEKYDEWRRYFFEVDKEMYEYFIQDLERLEVLEKNNRELNKIIGGLLKSKKDLYQENEKLKKIIKENFWVFNNDEVLFKFNEHTPVMQNELKEVLSK